MLTDDYGEKLSKKIKQSFYMTQMALAGHSLDQSLFVCISLRLLTFLTTISVLFITNPFQPQFLNEFFQMMLFPNFCDKMNFSLDVIKIIYAIFGLMMVIVYVSHLLGSHSNSFLTKLANLLIIQHTLFLVPKIHLSMYVLYQKQQTLSVIISAIFILMVVLSTLITGLNLAFKINPFRKRGIFWNVHNDIQFYQYLLCIARVIIIVVDGMTVAFLMINLVAQIYLRSVKSGYLTKQARQLQNLSSNLGISTYASILVCSYTGNSTLSTEIWVLLIAVSFIATIFRLVGIFKDQRYFPLCNCEIYEYYDFYFHFLSEKVKGNNKSKLSIKKDSESDKILSIHILNCQQKNCLVSKAHLSQDSYCQDLESLCTNMMKVKSKQSVRNQIIFEIWKFETGNKYKFRMQNKVLDYCYEFMVYNSLNLSRLNGVSDAINEENIKSLKNTFYDKLQNSLTCFSLFYEQIAKTQPKLESILSVGIDIRTKTTELKEMYNQLLKHSVVNFKTAEVYVEFQNFFLKQNGMNSESIDRLRKIQKSKQGQHIQQIYLPTLTSYAENGLIENMNTQCLSFFRLTRFQMKSKNIASLVYPEISSVNDIKEKLKSGKTLKVFSFFKKGDGMTYGSIKIKQKYIQNKKFDVITIEKQPYSDFKNVLLIKKTEKQLVSLLKEQSFVRPNITCNNKILLKWRYLYSNYFFSKMDELLQEKIVKIKIQELGGSNFVMSLEQTLHADYYLVNVKLIRDMEKKKNRVSSFMLNQADTNRGRGIKKFSFYYDCQNKDQDPCLYGVFNLESQRKNQQNDNSSQLGRFETQLNNKLVADTLLRQNKYSTEIKCYRLYEGDLYNIDLEDKEKYVQMFEGQSFHRNHDGATSNGEMDLYLIVAIIFVLCVFGGLSYFYFYNSSTAQTDIVPLYTNIVKIQQLRLYMNRMSAIVRQAYAGRYPNKTGFSWQMDILESYFALKDLRYQNLLFSSQQKMVEYRSINYTGSLNEIIDVMISHIYELAISNSMTLSQANDFQNTYIGTVNHLILGQRNQTRDSIENDSAHYTNLQNIFVGVGIGVVCLFYVLLGLLMVALNNIAKKKLHDLMMMSDGEARMNQTVADKLKYAVDMIKKNFDVDLKLILGPVEVHKQRKKPKELVMGTQKKVLIIIFILIGLCIHILLLYTVSSQMTTILTNVTTFQSQGQELIETYSVYTQVTNRIGQFNSLQRPTIRRLRENINFLSRNRGLYIFDDQTNNLIDTVFYQNSCALLDKMGVFANQSVTCSITLPGYVIANPFELSLIPYFSRMHYNILDNITSSYGCTGVYSGPFVTVLTDLLNKMRIYGESSTNDAFTTLNIYNFLEASLGVIYVLLTGSVVYLLKQTNIEISDLLKFLNNGVTPKPQSQAKKQTKQATKKSNVSIQNLTADDLHSHASDISQVQLNKK